jgi:hypothetical protein
MSLRTWRRQHGPDIVAQVEPIDGLGMWDPSTWRTVSPEAVMRTPQRIERLTEAQDAADALAREAFGHACDANACGPWLPKELTEDRRARRRT